MAYVYEVINRNLVGRHESQAYDKVVREIEKEMQSA